MYHHFITEKPTASYNTKEITRKLFHTYKSNIKRHNIQVMKHPLDMRNIKYALRGPSFRIEFGPGTILTPAPPRAV